MCGVTGSTRLSSPWYRLVPMAGKNTSVPRNIGLAWIVVLKVGCTVAEAFHCLARFASMHTLARNSW
jgi:hypothetical protein